MLPDVCGEDYALLMGGNLVSAALHKLGMPEDPLGPVNLRQGLSSKRSFSPQ
jgi:hypothetical protein